MMNNKNKKKTDENRTLLYGTGVLEEPTPLSPPTSPSQAGAAVAISSGADPEDPAQYNYHPANDENDSTRSSGSSSTGSYSSGGLPYKQQQRDNPNTPNGSMARLVLVAAATAATLGYDVGIMAAAIQPIEHVFNLTSVEKEVAMGSLNFVAALGALLGGKIANDHGRKATVQVCCWIFVVGTICMAVAPNFFVLLLGRIITGLGVGVSFVAAPLYLTEVAPTHLRGQLNTIFDVAINGGILLGYVVGFCIQLLPLPDEAGIKWRLMLGMGLLLPVIVLWNLHLLPESPRWLVMAGQSAGAALVLEQLSSRISGVGDNGENHAMTTCNNTEEILNTVRSIEQELQQEQQQPQQHPHSPSSSWSLSEIFPKWSSETRLAVALGFWQQITGTEAVLYYSADFLAHAGLESATQRLLGNVFVGLCKLTPELIAMQFVDRLGRRPLILASAVALMVSTFCLSLAFYASWSPLIIVLLLCAVMASFSIGLGPFTFLVASESLGLSERATGMTYCAAANRCTSGVVALTAVSLYEALGSSGLFAVYGMIGLVSLPFYVTCVPETTGQSLEDLAASRRQQHQQQQQGGGVLTEQEGVELHAELT